MKHRSTWLLPVVLALVLSVFCIPVFAIADGTDDVQPAGDAVLVQDVAAPADEVLVPKTGDAEQDEMTPEDVAPAEGSETEDPVVPAGPAVPEDVPATDEPATPETPEEAEPVSPETPETPAQTPEETEPATPATPETTEEAVEEEVVEAEVVEEELAAAPKEEEEEKKLTPPVVMAEAHVQNIGWKAAEDAGKKNIGSTGQGLRVEGFKFKLSGGDKVAGGIEYAAHVQNIGWQDFVRDGKLGGTTGKALRVEALKIRLYGDMAEKFDVYYCAHVQNLGWLSWAKNGQECGSSGLAYRMEAVRVRLVPKGDPAPANLTDSHPIPFFKGAILNMKSHVQDVGWSGWKGNGIAGTTGRSLRLEAFQAKLNGSNISGGIRYSSFVQGKGWSEWVENGATGGSTGEGKRLEGVKFELTGKAAEVYDVYYRLHVGQVGWLAWAKNGAAAGPAGVGLRVEAVQVQLVPKGNEAPSSYDVDLKKTTFGGSGLKVGAYVQRNGWQKDVGNGTTAGSVGAGLALQGLRISIDSKDNSLSGGIQYRTHVSGTGWTGWVKDGANSEKSGKTIEAIQIKLTGQLARAYDVYYRAHVRNKGWMGWAMNGASAGTSNQSLRMEAVQVRLVPKTSGAPGSTANAFSDRMSYMHPHVQSYSSPTDYLIFVDTFGRYVGIFRGYRGNWDQIYFWRCTVGGPEHPTVKGVFSIGSRGYAFGHGYTCYYWTQFYGDYLFHSIKYDEGTFNVQDGRLGHAVSMGCVRLAIENAKWINQNIPSGTTVVVW